MSDKLNESLSALLDGQANDIELERLLREIDDNKELRDKWQRLTLAQGAIAGAEVAHRQMDVSQRVKSILQSDQVSTRPAMQERVLRPFASFAVAASVAFTVVIGGQQLAQLQVDEAGANSIASSPSPVGMINTVGAVPVRARFGTAPVPVLEPATGTAYRRLAEQRLNRYMQEHAEHAALNSYQGMIPFARVPEIHE